MMSSKRSFGSGSPFAGTTKAREEAQIIELHTVSERAHDYQSAVELSPFISWVADKSGAAVSLSYHWTKFTGISIEEGLRDGWINAVHPHDRKRVLATWKQAHVSESSFETDLRLRMHDRSYKWFKAQASAKFEDNGEPTRWYGVLIDIHERKLGEIALRKSEGHYRSIMEASTDSIKVLSLNGRLEAVNGPGLCALEINEPATVLGKDWPSLWPSVSKHLAEAAVAQARSGKVANFSAGRPTAKGTFKWWDVVVSPIKDDRGRVERILSISRDVTAHRKLSEGLRRASELDSLTDLPNRRSFQIALDAAVLKAMERGSQVALIALDLDRFKQVNDTLGHPAGDHLLKVFADRLRASIRGLDFAARLGGDEFAVIIEDLTHEADLPKICEALLARLRAPMEFNGHVISGEASAGGAVFPRDAQSANELLENADAALYAGKADGRSGFKMYHNHIREKVQRTASQLSLARTIVAEKTIVPYYQPKVRLESGEIYGFEALLRWHHSRSGIQLPDTIAEGFKHFEIASSIGDLIQATVFEDMARWTKQGIRFGHIGINASPSEFLGDDYAERLLSKLAFFGLNPSSVEVEVTEHAFLERAAENVERAILKLSREGVRIALDDFGTGYSSLSHVKDFPVDVLKIDRSFVANIRERAESAAIVAAVIGLAQNLAIDVIAEGIESEDQRQFLLSKGCASGQGFLFGKATAGEYVPLLLDQSRGGRASLTQLPGAA